MNIGVHVSFQVGVFCFFGYISRSGIAGSCGISIFSFLRNRQKTIPIYILTNSVRWFPFLHIFTNIYLCSFWWQPFCQVWDNMSLRFWFAFPWWLVLLNIFSCDCWPSACLLWQNIYSSLYPFFNWNACIFDVELYELFICLVASFANIFSHSEGCLLVLFMVSFAVQKHLSFIRSHLFICVFISISLGAGSKRILLRFMS